MLPVFLMAMAAFLFYFQIMTVQLRLQQALEQAAQKAAALSYLEQVIPQEEDGTGNPILSYAGNFAVSALEGAFVKEEMLSCVSREWLDKSCIQNGADGLVCYGGVSSGEDYQIDLRISYTVQIPFLPSSVFTIPFTQRCERRAWVGWEMQADSGGQDAGEKKQIVYVTEYGTVYHIYKDCRSLKSQVHACTPESVKDLRNRNGAVYYACEYCVKGGMNAVLYVTDYGRRYHNSRVCGALMTYIREVERESVPDKRLCRFCEKRSAEQK